MTNFLKIGAKIVTFRKFGIEIIKEFFGMRLAVYIIKITLDKNERRN